MRIQRRVKSKLTRSVRAATGRTSKGDPVPTRFEKQEDVFLHSAQSATGLSLSEVVRRSVRLAKRQTDVLNGNYQFLLDLRP
jgi:hypothetical protein